MIGALLLLAMLGSQAPRDTLPVVTLREALQQAVKLDPDYVQSVGLLRNAESARKAALLVFLLPSVSASADYSQLSTKQFNVGTGSQANATGRASLDARYELFTGGRKWNDMRRASVELEGTEAAELGARFAAALEVEGDYYAVLGARELRDVAEQRRTRAREELVTARARVVSGATVQSDSLQVLLELQRAEVDVLRSGATLMVAQLQLGRRIGRASAVDAAPIDTLLPAPLEISLDDAVQQAVAQGPAWRTARATERSADLQIRSRQGSYFPTVTLVASLGKFDDKFFPTQTTRRSMGFSIALPIWDGGQRELAIARLKSSRDVARAIREDLERAARRDVTEAYTNYDVSRQALAISATGVAVATEILRVQQSRYRAGSGTVLELLDAQSQLVQAAADLVQSRYGVRLARAALETMLGRRLTNDPDRSTP
ncbi:MAG: TolC family protein [Gemmatimonadales bacterium]